jgi:hypothetical protein
VKERERDDALLARAVTMLDTVATGNESASVDCSAILVRYGVTSVSVQIVALAFWGKPDRDWIGAAAP